MIESAKSAKFKYLMKRLLRHKRVEWEIECERGREGEL